MYKYLPKRLQIKYYTNEEAEDEDEEEDEPVELDSIDPEPTVRDKSKKSRGKFRNIQKRDNMRMSNEEHVQRGFILHGGATNGTLSETGTLRKRRIH
jgi:hypothetical protein